MHLPVKPHKALGSNNLQNKPINIGFFATKYCHICMIFSNIINRPNNRAKRAEDWCLQPCGFGSYTNNWSVDWHFLYLSQNMAHLTR